MALPDRPKKPVLPVKVESAEPELAPQKATFRGASLGDTFDEIREKEIADKLSRLNKKLGTSGNINPLYNDLTVEDLLVNGWDRYDYLMPKVLKAKAWLTEVLQEQNLSVDVAEARLKRGLKYDEMYTLILELLTRHHMTDRSVSTYDYQIISALVANEILGLGPLEPLWRDSRISEIMVNGASTIRIEMGGRLMDVPGARFRSSEHANEIAQQILAPIGRTVDVSHPLADGSLVDGSRVNIVHQSIAEKGPYITIRRFPDTVFSLRELVSFGSMNEEMAAEMGNLIGAGLNTIIVGGTGTGKCLSLATKLPTPTSFTIMGEIRVGDYVLDENGNPTKVTGYFPQPLKPCFELTFSDGSKVVAGEDHNWYTSTHSARQALNRKASKNQSDKSILESIVTTREIYETLRTAHGHINHAVKLVSKAVPYPHKDLAVSPYVYGAGLRDREGLSSTDAICGVDDETFDNIIPDEYLYSSEDQRRALIAGMLDVDGTVDKRTGAVIYSNSNKNIIDGFRQIIHSLGYQSTLTETIQEEEKQGKIAYTVSFFTTDDVFHLESKNAIHQEIRTSKSQDNRMEYRFIVDCVPVESVPTACISVDSPEHLYLCTEAFITTHNTSTLNALSGCIPPGERVLVIEDTSELRLHPERDILYLQARPAQHEGSGAITIRDLVKNALRMRPDRIVVGEVRDFAAYDMLQAMNTGHDGSMTTIHANDAHSGVERLVNLLSEGGASAVDSSRVLSLISSGVDLFVTIERYEDGSRRCSGIYEIPNMVTVKDGRVTLEPIPLWEFVQDTADEDEEVFDGILKVTGHWEKRNEVSESMRKKHRLDHSPVLSYEEICKLSEQSSKA